MRLFYRLRYTHHRYMATRDPAIGSLSRAISRNELSAAADAPAAANGGSGAMPSISEALGNSTTAFDTTADEERLQAGADDETMKDDLDDLKEILGHSAGAGDLYLDLRRAALCSFFAQRCPSTLLTRSTRLRCGPLAAAAVAYAEDVRCGLCEGAAVRGDLVLIGSRCVQAIHEHGPAHRA